MLAVGRWMAPWRQLLLHHGVPAGPLRPSSEGFLDSQHRCYGGISHGAISKRDQICITFSMVGACDGLCVHVCKKMQQHLAICFLRCWSCQHALIRYKHSENTMWPRTDLALQVSRKTQCLVLWPGHKTNTGYHFFYFIHIWICQQGIYHGWHWNIPPLTQTPNYMLWSCHVHQSIRCRTQIFDRLSLVIASFELLHQASSQICSCQEGAAFYHKEGAAEFSAIQHAIVLEIDNWFCTKTWQSLVKDQPVSCCVCSLFARCSGPEVLKTADIC